MKTVIRIALDHDGKLELQNMTGHLDHDEMYKVVGALEVLKHTLVDQFEFEDMSVNDVDDVRRLLDE